MPWLFVRFVRDNGIGAEDLRWFVNIIGYFTGHEYPSASFNAGEKLVFWLVLVLGSTVLIVTGLVLVFPNFDQTRSTMQIANIIHMIAAYLAIALACVHIYLGTIGMTGAYRAMRDGYVERAGPSIITCAGTRRSSPARRARNSSRRQRRNAAERVDAQDAA